MQVRLADQARYHHQLQASSLAVDLQWCYCPPANVKKIRTIEVLHLFRCYTHTPRVAGFDSFGRTSLQMSARSFKYKRLSGANVQSRVQSLRREIRLSLKCLDRVTKAHSFNHPPRVVDFPRCHSSRQSG